jgi:hypothetical protein
VLTGTTSRWGRERPAIGFDCHKPSAAAHEYDSTEMRWLRGSMRQPLAAAVGQRFNFDERVAGAARRCSLQVITGNRAAFGPPDVSTLDVAIPEEVGQHGIACKVQEELAAPGGALQGLFTEDNQGFACLKDNRRSGRVDIVG